MLHSDLLEVLHRWTADRPGEVLREDRSRDAHRVGQRDQRPRPLGCSRASGRARELRPGRRPPGTPPTALDLPRYCRTVSRNIDSLSRSRTDAPPGAPSSSANASSTSRAQPLLGPRQVQHRRQAAPAPRRTVATQTRGSRRQSWCARSPSPKVNEAGALARRHAAEQADQLSGIVGRRRTAGSEAGRRTGSTRRRAGRSRPHRPAAAPVGRPPGRSSRTPRAARGTTRRCASAGRKPR